MTTAKRKVMHEKQVTKRWKNILSCSWQRYILSLNSDNSHGDTSLYESEMFYLNTSKIGKTQLSKTNRELKKWSKIISSHPNWRYLNQLQISGLSPVSYLHYKSLQDKRWRIWRHSEILIQKIKQIMWPIQRQVWKPWPKLGARQENGMG